MSGECVVGDRIMHRKFGLGTIIGIDATANGAVGRIAFDVGSEHRILLDREHLRGAVHWIDAVEMLDQPVNRIRLTVARSLGSDAPFDITLFAPARTLEGPPPVAGDDVQAVV